MRRIIWLGIICILWPTAPANGLQRWEFHTAADGQAWKVGNQLADFAVSENRLRMTLAGADPYFFSPPVDMPLDGCVVRVRMNSDHDGDTQVFWTTDQQGWDQNNYVVQSTSASSEPQTFEFIIGRAADAGRRLTGFRIDPYNNLEGKGQVAIEWIELERLPPVLDVNFAITSHQVQMGESVTARLQVRPIDGKAVNGPWVAELPNDAQRPIESTAMNSSIRFDKPGVQRAHAKISATSDTSQYDLETSVIVGRDESLPLVPLLRSEHIRLDLIPVAAGNGFGGARYQISDEQGQWHNCGWLLPLAELAIETDKHVYLHHPTFALQGHDLTSAHLNAQVGDGWQIELQFKIVAKNSLETIEVATSLSGPKDGRLLNFSLPIFRAESSGADPLQRYGLFGGLEFLEPGWRSSSDRAVGAKFADRWSPHPFKVTLPVMAVEADDLTCAVMWQPLEPWAGDYALPTATFASPNFLDGQPNHLMRLSAPSIPQWSRENERLARTAYVMRPDIPVRMRYWLFAQHRLPVAMTSRVWYEFFGPPTKPPVLYKDRELYDLIAQNFGETMYWPGKGWQFHWLVIDGPQFIGSIAGELIAYALETGQNKYLVPDLSKKSILDVVGPLSNRLRDSQGAKSALERMRPDGTWPFTNTEQMRKQTREFTQGEHDSLGEDGSTSLGTCVQAALPLLRHAELTGDSKYVQASLKALQAMRQFRVPRGAQVWEVHQEIPDIRAAALAIEAYQIGYHLDGDLKWLEEASYWAWTGVPFLYSWAVPIGTNGRVLASPTRDDPKFMSWPMDEMYQQPRRAITPFGSVPVLGPSFYVANWFGVLVQWCGLEWALKVIELDRNRPDPLLRYIADGVVASGLQQMFDKPPRVGLYPDAWNLLNNRASRPLLSAILPLQCLQAEQRAPRWSRTWTRVLRDRDHKRQWHVSGWGVPVDLPAPEQQVTWSAVVAMPKGQPNELIVAGVDAPDRVTLDNNLLNREPLPEPKIGSDGWWYWPEQRAIIVHFKQESERAVIHINW